MSEGSIRFGVCGTAHWAETVHLPALRQAEGVDLVAVYGRNPARVEALSQRFGVGGFTDFTAMLDCVDAVAFAVPPDVQASLALQAAQAGKGLMLEKPPAMSVESASTLMTEIAARDLPAACFLTRRFIPEISAFIDEGRRRGALGGEAVFSVGAPPADSPYAGSIWRRAPDAAIWDVGPHALTFLIGLLGPIGGVRAERDASGVIRATFAHDARAASTLILDQNAPADRQEELFRFTAEGRTFELAKPPYDRVACFRQALGEFRRAFWGRSPRWAGAAGAFDMIAALAGVERSLAKGGEIATAHKLSDRL